MENSPTKEKRHEIKMIREAVKFVLACFFVVCATMYLTLKYVRSDERVTHGPNIMFETEKWDFGSVKPGEQFDCAFPFTNVGDTELFITNVQSTCGCTAVADSNTEEFIAPADKSRIEVLFTAPRQSGALSKKIKVYSNSMINPECTLEIIANVIVPLELNPRVLECGDLKFGEQKSVRGTFRGPLLSSISLGETEVLNSNSSNEYSIAFEDRELNGERELAVCVTVTESRQLGKFSDGIRIQTDSPDWPYCDILVTGNIVAPFELDTPVVWFPAYETSRESTFRMNILNTGDQKHNVTDYSTDIEGLEIQITGPDGSGNYSMDVVIPSSYKGPVPRGSITLKTDAPGMSEFEIPVRARLASYVTWGEELD